MKRLLSTTTAFAVALGSMPPLPVFAQTLDESGRVIGADGTVLCEPTADAVCDFDEIMKQLADGQQPAEAAAAEAAAAEAAAAAAAAVAEAAAAEAEAQRLADEAAAAAEAEAQRAAEEAAALAAAEAERAAEAAAAAAAAEAEQAAAEAAAAEADAQRAAMEAAAAAEAEAQHATEEAAAAAEAEAKRLADESAAGAEADAQLAAEVAVKAEADAQAAAADAEAAAASQVAAEEDAAAAKVDAQAAADDAAATVEVDAATAEDAAATVDVDATSAEGAEVPVEPETAEAPTEDAVVPVEPESAEAPPKDAAPAEGGAVEAVEGTEETKSDETVAVEREVIPEPTPEAIQTLETLLGTPEVEASGDVKVAPTAEAAALPLTDVVPDGETAPAVDAVATVVKEVTEADTRSSSEEFSATAAATATATATATAAEPGKKKGLSDLEKVGLIALGALVVGAILKNGDRVEQNTGDRVVVQREDGSYVILKDDDTLLRRPGATIRTETFRDGSTRTIVERVDGSRVITIRDASGRVLRRVAIDARGRETLLIDDLVPVEPIDVATLPRPRNPVTISASGSDAALAAAMAAVAARDLPRSFSLRQIRDIHEVRALAPVIDVEPITFATGSSAIAVTEAEKLADLGRLITQLIAARPNELFLIEGHTDAVGSAASNLTLSDRRAESVALALTEYFDVPPENLVVQGYGESDLLVQTDGNEPRNRRVAARLVTPLLAASN